MIDRFKPWWSQRSARERVMLLVMFGLIALTLGWLLLIRPMGDALADARGRHDRAVIARGEASAQAAEITALERRGAPALPAPIHVWLEQKAGEAGFSDAHVQPGDGGKATVAINAVRPQAFFGWIGELESRDGLIVDGLKANANNDATLSVEATFRVRAQ